MHQLSNLIVQIKNGLLAGKEEVIVSFSKLNKSVLEVLKEEGYIEDYKVFKNDNFKYIKVNLNGNKIITDIKVVSKPGRRIYSGLEELKKSKSNLGTMIVSTPKGVLSIAKSINSKVGGEILCRIW